MERGRERDETCVCIRAGAESWHRQHVLAPLVHMCCADALAGTSSLASGPGSSAARHQAAKQLDVCRTLSRSPTSGSLLTTSPTAVTRRIIFLAM